MLVAASAAAQPVPKLNGASRDYVTRGSTVDLVFSGENLAQVREFIVSGESGVTLAIIPVAKPTVNVESSGGGLSTVLPPEEKTLIAKLAVAVAAPLGAREIRASGPGGVSNPVTLNISHLPEIADSNANSSFSAAQTVALPVAITGRIAAGGETDHYRFSAKKGEHVVFEVYAYRMGSPLDSSLTILDKNGKELARNEDTKGLDSVLDFAVPEDGDYVVQLRDFRFQGGGNFNYRLIGGALPYAYSVFPFGGQRGTRVELEAQGPNFDNGGKMILNIEPNALLGRQDIRISAGKGLSNPFPFEVSELPQFLEKEPNSALDQADNVGLPVAINGKIDGPNDYDAFRFHAEKDQFVVFEVLAGRYGSQLDALLTLSDELGNVIQRNDDATGADARIEHRFAAAGNYHIIVEDLLGRGGVNFGYRLTASAPKPNYAVSFQPDTARIHRGGHLPIRCEVNRMSGFNGTVRVELKDLPPGLYGEPLVFAPDGPAAGYLMLVATESAPLGTVPLRLASAALLNGEWVARPSSPVSGAKGTFLTVVDEVPFTLSPLTLMSSIEQEQSADLVVFAQRKQGFNGEIKLTVEGFSNGRDNGVGRSFDYNPVVIKPNELKGVLNLRAKLGCEIDSRPVLVRGESVVNGQPVVQYSSFVPVTTREIPFVLTTSMKKVTVTAVPPGSKSAAAEAFFTIRAERRAGFNGDINIAVEGAPEGVAVTAEKIAPNSSETTIRLLASDKAPAGKEFNLTFKGTGVFNDRNYRYNPSAVTLSVNAPEPVEAKPAAITSASAK